MYKTDTSAVSTAAFGIQGYVTSANVAMPRGAPTATTPNGTAITTTSGSVGTLGPTRLQIDDVLTRHTEVWPSTPITTLSL